MNDFPSEIILHWSREDQAFIADVPGLPGCAALQPPRNSYAEKRHASIAETAWIMPRPSSQLDARCELRSRYAGHGYKGQRAPGIIEVDNWPQVRQRGIHRRYRHPSKPGTAAIAGKPGVAVQPGTLSSILRQAGFKK